MQLDSFLQFIQFSERDRAALRRLWTDVEPEVDRICALFYERILGDPVTAAVLANPDRVRGLMASLRVWLRELLNGPWDTAYVERRLRIGRVHTFYGVPHEAMFSAMCVVSNELVGLACRSEGETAAAVQAVVRVTDFDLAIMTSSFHERRQQNAIRDVQNLMLANLPALAVLIDTSLLCMAATPGFRSRFDLEDIVGRDIRALLPGPLLRAAQLEDILRRASTGDRGIHRPRCEFEEAGVRRHFAVSVVPIRDGTGAVLLHMEDHTAAVENEALLQRQESLAHLGTLSATIAHELRNPLAGISGALQVMANAMPAEDRFAPIIGKVLEQTRGLNRLVSDLLAFARPRNPSMTDGLDLVPIVEQAVDSVRADFPHAEMVIEGQAHTSADADMIRQILLNLLYNACQATGGEGRVIVTMEKDALLVSDNGPGIPSELLATLFEPFVTTKVRGTGLGLAISQKLARLMGMQLDLLSAGGANSRSGGAEFRVRFP
jgi:signal transduction histidine kinase